MGDTTTNRDYRKPLSTDDPVAMVDFWRNLADDVDADVASIFSAWFTPVHDTSIGSAASGFTDSSSDAYTLLNGHLVMVCIRVNVTSAITATSGNFGDTLCFTVDTAYRPAGIINGVAGNGTTTGEATLSTDGTVTLRAASDTVATGGPLRIDFTFIQP